MPSLKLTQAAVDRVKPPEKGSGRIELWDSQLPGFGLRVSDSGRKTWVALYRVKGKLVRETIGTLALIPKVDDARARARASMQKAQAGVHPVKARRQKEIEVAAAEQAREQDTLTAVIQRYLTRYAVKRMRPDYFKETKRTLERDVIPTLGSWPIREITRRDVRELIEAIVDRGSGSQGNHALSYLRAMFNWACDNDLIETNPCDRLKMPAPLVERDRTLTDDEIRLFRLACTEIGWPFGPLFQLLLLTAARRGELAQAIWAEFDLGGMLWTLPRSRSKNDKAHLTHLSPLALEILRGLPKIGDKGFLFSTTGVSPVSGFGYARDRVIEEMTQRLKSELLAAGETGAAEKAKIEHFALHDLRRSAASGMAALGIAPHVVDKILNHASGQIRGVALIYNRHAYVDERKAALEAWARHVEGLIRPASSNVVTFAGAR